MLQVGRRPVASGGARLLRLNVGGLTSPRRETVQPFDNVSKHWFVALVRAQVSTLLNKTAIDIVKAGQLEIFTPSYFFAARKK